MDPVTQGALGAAVAVSKARPQQITGAILLGALAGMAPDLYVAIRSSSDPLLFLEYHRQFTHSLLFIPFGALLCALVLHPLSARWSGLAFRQAWMFCLLGYATHGLLDACTTYGTLLLWPFSDARIGWNSSSVVGRLFTLPLLGFAITGA